MKNTKLAKLAFAVIGGALFGAGIGAVMNLMCNLRDGGGFIADPVVPMIITTAAGAIAGLFVGAADL